MSKIKGYNKSMSQIHEKNSRLYVVVDKSLKKSYQACQAAHAVAQHILDGGSWKNETIVLLKADSSFLERCAKEGWTIFREPGQDYMLTAVAGLNKNEECKELKLI